jgi:hypothetical protein
MLKKFVITSGKNLKGLNTSKKIIFLINGLTEYQKNDLIDIKSIEDVKKLVPSLPQAILDTYPIFYDTEPETFMANKYKFRLFYCPNITFEK